MNDNICDMKRLLIFGLVFIAVSADAQFTGTDSLRNYNNRYITTNPATAFTNNRLNTLLRGIIDFIDTARAGTGGGGALGIDTVFAVNDSTIRYRKNGVFRQFTLKGVYESRRKVDTIYKSNDTTLIFTVNGSVRTIIIPGGTNVNLATANQGATGNRNHNWNDYWLYINNTKSFEINTDHADPNHLNNRYKARMFTDSTADGDPVKLYWGLRNINDDLQDSVHFELGSTSSSTRIYHSALDSTKVVVIDLNAGVTTPSLLVSVKNMAKNSSFTFGQTTTLNPADSLAIKAIPAASADSVLAVRSANVGVNTVIKIPANSIGSAIQLTDSSFKVGNDTITIRGTGGGGGVSQNIVDTVNNNLPTGAIYSDKIFFGPPGNDSTWRIIYLNGDLIQQRNEGGSWVSKMAMSIEDDIVIPDSVYFVGSTWDAFGDSYTQGVGASPSSNKYITLLETNLGMTANNFGTSGAGIMDVQFHMYQDIDTLDRLPVTLLIGFNDYLKSSDGSKTQTMFSPAFRAAIFNHLLNKVVPANDVNITTTGSWSNFDLSTSYPQKSKRLNSGAGRLSVASSAGDSKEWGFEGPNCGFFFLGTHNTDYGRLKVEIDGVSVDTVDQSNVADNQTVFANSAGRTEDIISAAAVYTGLSSGSHTIKVTLLDNANTNVDAFGTMALPGDAQSMVVGSIQKLQSAGYTAMSASFPKNNSGVDATNLIIQAVVNEFRTLGYPVVYVDVNSFTNPAVDIDTDNVHWDNSGHLAGKNAFRSKIRL